MAKAPNQNGSDSEGRKLGERSGLDTRVVLAVNAASKVLHNLQGYAVSKRNRLARRLGSTVARLKLKGIGGGAQQGVRRAV